MPLCKFAFIFSRFVLGKWSVFSLFPFVNYPATHLTWPTVNVLSFMYLACKLFTLAKDPDFTDRQNNRWKDRWAFV